MVSNLLTNHWKWILPLPGSPRLTPLIISGVYMYMVARFSLNLCIWVRTASNNLSAVITVSHAAVESLWNHEHPHTYTQAHNCARTLKGTRDERHSCLGETGKSGDYWGLHTALAVWMCVWVCVCILYEGQMSSQDEKSVDFTIPDPAFSFSAFVCVCVCVCVCRTLTC